LSVITCVFVRRFISATQPPFDTVSAGCFGADYYQLNCSLDAHLEEGVAPTLTEARRVRAFAAPGPTAGLSPCTPRSLVLGGLHWHYISCILSVYGFYIPCIYCMRIISIYLLILLSVIVFLYILYILSVYFLSCERIHLLCTVCVLFYLCVTMYAYT
jgi:hypothetical protein